MAADRLVFVFDENLTRLARVIAELRSDVTWFGAPGIDDVLPRSVVDSEWIPVVAHLGWVVITDDKRIRTRPAEASRAVTNGLKVIHLHGVGDRSTWDQAVHLLAQWRAIEKRVAELGRGPWWVSVRRNGIRVLGFEPGKIDR